MKVGNLVRLGKHTFYSLKVGQIIEVCDNCTYRILVSGDIKYFTDFDFEIIQ
jgi:hypothetical protein